MIHQNQNFQKLIGQRVLRWAGTEMAAGQGANESPIVWADLSSGYLQFFDMEVHLSEGSVERFVSGLDDDGNYFGMFVGSSNEPLKLYDATGADILRARLIGELPSGRIEDIRKHLGEDGFVSEIIITIESTEITISCGELTFENRQYTVVKPQEFLLVTL